MAQIDRFKLVRRIEMMNQPDRLGSLLINIQDGPPAPIYALTTETPNLPVDRDREQPWGRGASPARSPGSPTTAKGSALIVAVMVLWCLSWDFPESFVLRLSFWLWYPCEGMFWFFHSFFSSFVLLKIMIGLFHYFALFGHHFYRFLVLSSTFVLDGITTCLFFTLILDLNFPACSNWSGIWKCIDYGTFTAKLTFVFLTIVNCSLAQLLGSSGLTDECKQLFVDL